MASSQPCSDDETSGFSGFDHPSEDFAGDTFYPDDLLPTRFCLSGGSLAQLFDDVLCWSSDSEEMILDSKPDSAYQLPLSEGVGSTNSQTSQSIWDSVDENEDSGSTSCDVSAPLASGPCTGLVGLTYFAAHELSYLFPPRNQS
jgi:hypothetical protein